MTMKNAFSIATTGIQRFENLAYNDYIAETEKARAAERARILGEKPRSPWREIKRNVMAYLESTLTK